uniref:Uncharacterized protein n=1 Tax=Eutreptiella gymnastica TaxID=73025 RepID=A0A7S1I7K2_9EUGL|mmetsp:Transcript_136432/g.236708  ORF Transcript_136432/g.236708 Transcript_136432/m.236708 type:complete len:420 (+) Transcript_136432:35-1294(+)
MPFFKRKDKKESGKTTPSADHGALPPASCPPDAQHSSCPGAAPPASPARKSPEHPISHSPNYTYIKKKSVSHADFTPLDTLENNAAADVGIRLRDRSEVHDVQPMQTPVGPIYGFLRHKGMKGAPDEAAEAGTPDGPDPAPLQESDVSPTASDDVPDNKALDRLEHAGGQQREEQEAPHPSVQPSKSHADAPPAFEPQYAIIRKKKPDLAPTAASGSPHSPLGAYPPGYTFLKKRDGQRSPSASPQLPPEVASVHGIGCAPPQEPDVSCTAAKQAQASGNSMVSEDALPNSCSGTVDSIRSCETSPVQNPEHSRNTQVMPQDVLSTEGSQFLSSSEDLQSSSAAPDNEDDAATTANGTSLVSSVARDEVSKSPTFTYLKKSRASHEPLSPQDVPQAIADGERNEAATSLNSPQYTFLKK